MEAIQKTIVTYYLSPDEVSEAKDLFDWDKRFIKENINSKKEITEMFENSDDGLAKVTVRRIDEDTIKFESTVIQYFTEEE